MPSCPKTSLAETAACPLAEALVLPVETPSLDGTPKRLGSFAVCNVILMEEGLVNAGNDNDGALPPPVISAPPERELERKLKLNPDDKDAKADVGSDESMDASDPPAAAQPGNGDDPAPSSGFPE